jgi:hypothetical protein
MSPRCRTRRGFSIFLSCFIFRRLLVFCLLVCCLLVCCLLVCCLLVCCLLVCWFAGLLIAGLLFAGLLLACLLLAGLLVCCLLLAVLLFCCSRPLPPACARAAEWRVEPLRQSSRVPPVESFCEPPFTVLIPHGHWCEARTARASGYGSHAVLSHPAGFSLFRHSLRITNQNRLHAIICYR